MADKGLKGFYQSFKDNDVRLNFQFRLDIDKLNQDGIDFSFFGQATSIPAKTINTEESLAYQGFLFSVPTNITFTRPWSVTVRLDKEGKVRDLLEDWQKEYADLSLGGGGEKSFSDIVARVDLLDRSLNNIVKTFTFVGIHPLELGDITLAHEDTGLTIMEVQFNYQYYYSDEDPLK